MATIQLFKTQIPFFSTNQQNCNILTKIHLKSSEVTSNTCSDINPLIKKKFFFNSINDLWLYENWPRKMTYIKAGQIQRIAPILTSSCSIDIASPIFIHKIHLNIAIYKINCHYLDEKTKRTRIPLNYHNLKFHMKKFNPLETAPVLVHYWLHL